MRPATLTTNLTVLLVLGLAAAAVVAVNTPGASPSVAVEGIEARGRAPAGATLEALPVVERVAIPAGAFHATEGVAFAATHNIFTNGCLETTGYSAASAQIQLPHGAEVIGGETALFDDTAAGPELQLTVFGLEQVDPVTPGEPSYVGVFQSTSNSIGDGSGWQVLDDAEPFTVDNNGLAYDVVLVMSAAGLQFCSFVLEYIPPSDGGLLFHSLPACAVFDTRTGRGGREAPLAAGETVEFDLDLADSSSQGGVAEDCGVPPVATPENPAGTQGVLLNLVALNTTSGGNLKAWDVDEGEPAGGVLVYNAGATANAYVPIGQTDPGFFDDQLTDVKNNGGAPVDVRGVVVGYFTAP